MTEHVCLPFFGGVLGVPGVPPSVDAALHGTHVRFIGVPGVLKDVILEHQEHQNTGVVFSGNPHEIRLEHMEHQEHHKK